MSADDYCAPMASPSFELHASSRDCLVALLLTADLPCEWDGEHSGRLFVVDMPSGYAAFACATHLAEAVVASVEGDV